MNRRGLLRSLASLALAPFVRFLPKSISNRLPNVCIGTSAEPGIITGGILLDRSVFKIPIPADKFTHIETSTTFREGKKPETIVFANGSRVETVPAPEYKVIASNTLPVGAELEGLRGLGGEVWIDPDDDDDEEWRRCPTCGLIHFPTESEI